MIIAVDLGLVGPQAVSVVNRRDTLHHRDKKRPHPKMPPLWFCFY